jgi:NAD(P)H dehydrogenase (quinone)
MTTLIIYAHPPTRGHNSFVIKTVLGELKKNKTSYELVDLYKERFDPVLSAQEHYTSGNKAVSEQIIKYQSLVRNADKLMFVFPWWWGGPPAILKGWCEKVLTNNFAFRYVPFNIGFGIRARPTPLLVGKRAAVLITMGAPRIFDLFVLGLPQQHFAWSILRFVGIRTKNFVVFSCTGRVDEKKKKELQKNVLKAFKWLKL